MGGVSQETDSETEICAQEADQGVLSGSTWMGEGSDIGLEREGKLGNSE